MKLKTPTLFLFFLLSIFFLLSSSIHMRKSHKHQKVLHHDHFSFQRPQIPLKDDPPANTTTSDVPQNQSNATDTPPDNSSVTNTTDNSTNNTSVMVDIMMCPFLMNLTNGAEAANQSINNSTDNATATTNGTDNTTQQGDNSSNVTANVGQSFKEQKKDDPTAIATDNSTTANTTTAAANATTSDAGAGTTTAGTTTAATDASGSSATAANGGTTAATATASDSGANAGATTTSTPTDNSTATSTNTNNSGDASNAAAVSTGDASLNATAGGSDNSTAGNTAVNNSVNNSQNASKQINLTGPNGEQLERVEIVQKLSPYAQVEYHEREKPEYKNNFMIGKPVYVENNITYDETPNIFDKVVTESLTGVVTPIIPEYKLWKNFNNKVFRPVPFNEKLEPMELTESPVIKSRPVNIEIRKITETKKPKSIDSHLLDLPNPIKPQVYGNKYDSVISLDELPQEGDVVHQKVVSYSVKKNVKSPDV